MADKNKQKTFVKYYVDGKEMRFNREAFKTEFDRKAAENNISVSKYMDELGMAINVTGGAIKNWYYKQVSPESLMLIENAAKELGIGVDRLLIEVKSMQEVKDKKDMIIDDRAKESIFKAYRELKKQFEYFLYEFDNPSPMLDLADDIVEFISKNRHMMVIEKSMDENERVKTKELIGLQQELTEYRRTYLAKADELYSLLEDYLLEIPDPIYNLWENMVLEMRESIEDSLTEFINLSPYTSDDKLYDENVPYTSYNIVYHVTEWPVLFMSEASYTIKPMLYK